MLITLQTWVPHIPLLGDLMQLSAIKLVGPCTWDSIDKEKQAGHHVFWQRAIDFILHRLHQAVHSDTICNGKERHFLI